MWDIGGVVTRVGDETDRRDVVAVGRQGHPERDRSALRRRTSSATSIESIKLDPFHVSANTDPKGDRSKRPQDQDPDMLVHVVKETDAGIVIRGAKYETAAAYANQAFLKPTIANWGDAKLSEYALGCIVKMNAPGVKHICRTGFTGRAPARDYPLSNRFDEVDTLVILDNVLIPWEDVLFYQHTRAAAFIRQTLHRYSAFPFVQRTLSYRRSDDRRGPVERQADRPRQAAGGAGKALRARRLARRHQCPSDRRDRHGREEPQRPAHAQPVAADDRPLPCPHQPAAHDAHRRANSAAARSA